MLVSILLSINIALLLTIFAFLLGCTIGCLDDIWKDYFSTTPHDVFERFVRKILSKITGK